MSESTKAELSLIDATMIGMGAMIGAGIFVLTGLAAEISGPAAVAVFALNGVVTLFTALAYAELASGIPKSGGGYAFVNELFGDVSSFMMGWMLGFAYIIAGSLYALGFASNFIHFTEIYTSAIPELPILFAIGSIFVFVLLNALSTAASGSVETIITIVKIIILIVFSAYGALEVDPSEFSPFAPNGALFPVLSAMGLTFIAFEGYDLITTVTEEVENPRVNVPRAIFISLGATVVIYLVVVTVAIGNLGASTLGEAGEVGIAEAAAEFMPEIPLLGTGASFIAFGAVFSTLSALNAVVIASSRVLFAMGRDEYLPAKIGRVSGRFGTPAVAVILCGVLMLGGVVAFPIERVGRVSSLFFLLSFVLVNAAIIKLRYKRDEIRREYKMPLFPLFPILGILMNLLLAVILFVDDPISGAISLIWLGIGFVAYYILQKE